MIPSTYRRFIAINRLTFSRNISGVQNLFSSPNKTGEHHIEDDDKICEEIISSTRDFGGVTKMQLKDINKNLMRASPIYRLSKFLNCSDSDARRILEENKEVEELPLRKLKEAIEILYEHGISAKKIIENPFLITIDKSSLNMKIKILKEMEGSKFEDIIPLLRVTPLVLRRVLRIQDDDKQNFPGRNFRFGNRINYISNALKVAPHIVAKHFSTHMFIYGIPFSQLNENLNTLLHYEIESKHILQDLWVFKYLPEKVKERFEFVRSAGRFNLRPWMVRCKIEVLENSVNLFQQNKTLLGNDTIVDYIAKRLNYDTYTMKVIISKHPAIFKCKGKSIFFLSKLPNSLFNFSEKNQRCSGLSPR